MCGIAGVYNSNGLSEELRRSVRRMTDLLAHRGPDDEGLYTSETCVLGHRRLSIIDLSKDGHQPYSSEDGTLQLIFNGEIYNYLELREELRSRGHTFRTKTDTEVLLEAYLEYGRDCLHKLNGMFAFALFDTRSNELFVARDRVGIKPLYYIVLDKTFVFASEIKAFRALPISLSVNNQCLFDFLIFNRTDVFDQTLFAEVKRLPKGHYGILKKESFHIARWWNPESFLDSQRECTADEAAKEVESIMLSAVDLRMRSDVPVGSCLSGGLDSSILVGILFEKGLVANDYATFTASFPDHPIDETAYVDLLNKRFPFTNHRIMPTAELALNKLEEFVYYNDEPAPSASFFSQYIVMKLVAEMGVTVLLDGQGGDENFAGYQYFHAFYWNELLKKLKLIRCGSEIVKALIKKQHVSAFQTLLYQLLPPLLKKKALLHTVPYVDRDFFEAYVEKSKIFNEFFDADTLNKSLLRHHQYKLEHLLRCEDRNSMAYSLEARVPYLDHRLIEYSLSIPGNLKIKDGGTKYLQKLGLGHYTIPEIVNRTDKIGFGTPENDWMKTANWQKQTSESYKSIVESFPYVFRKDTTLSATGSDRWKINQLDAWYRVCLKKKEVKLLPVRAKASAVDC